MESEIINNILTKLRQEQNQCQNEIWKNIPNYEGLYIISNLGSVRSLDRICYDGRYNAGIPIRERIVGGYKRINLNKNNKSKTISLHRLIAKAFIPNPKNKPCINHKDCNKLNNKIENLEWVTKKENTLHAIKNGKLNFIFGENNFFSKLKFENIKKIREEYLQTNLTYKEIAKKYNISSTNIGKIVRNESWFDENYSKIVNSESFKNKTKLNKRGEKQHTSKLKNTDILEIRKLWKTKLYSIKEINQKFPNVHHNTISKIVSNQTWKYT